MNRNPVSGKTATGWFTEIVPGDPSRHRLHEKKTTCELPCIISTLLLLQQKSLHIGLVADGQTACCTVVALGWMDMNDCSQLRSGSWAVELLLPQAFWRCNWLWSCTATMDGMIAVNWAALVVLWVQERGPSQWTQQTQPIVLPCLGFSHFFLKIVCWKYCCFWKRMQNILLVWIPNLGTSDEFTLVSQQEKNIWSFVAHALFLKTNFSYIYMPMFPCWAVPFLAFDHVIPVLPWKTNPLLTLSSLWLLIYHVMEALWNGHWSPLSHDAISEWNKLSNIGLLVENMASRVVRPRRDVAWMAAMIIIMIHISVAFISSVWELLLAARIPVPVGS